MNKNTHYVVVGCPRSGTSMMMSALNAAGVEVLYDEEYDKKMHDGFKKYHGSNWKETAPFFENPLPITKGGKLVKVLLRNFISILNNKVFPKPTYKTIYMNRKLTDAKESFKKLMGCKDDSPQLQNLFVEHTKNVNLVKKCSNVDFFEVSFEKMIDSPKEIFEELKNAGWPIKDIDAAVKDVESRKTMFL